MAIAKVQTTAVSAFLGNSTTVVSGTSTGYQRTLTVTAGSLLVARIFIRNANAAGDLISGLSDNKAQTWTKRVSQRDNAESGYGWVYLYECVNAGAGSTTVSLDCAIEDNNNYIVWEVSEFSGVDTSSPFDTGTDKTGNVDADTTPLTTTATAAPSQADTLAVGVMGAKWWYYSNTDDSPPTNYTIDGLQTDNSYAYFQSCHRILSASAAQTLSWSGPTGQSSTDGAVGAIAIYKAAASGTSLRVRATFNTAINSDSGITAYVWTGEPSSVVAQKYTGLTAEASGGILLIPLSGGSYTNGQSVNVLAFNSSDTSGLVTATVESY